jgi:hypothetical protein
LDEADTGFDKTGLTTTTTNEQAEQPWMDAATLMLLGC